MHFSEPPHPPDVINDWSLMLLLNQNPSLHNLYGAKNRLYKSSYLVYASTGIIEMLSAEGLGKVYHSTHLIIKCPH